MCCLKYFALTLLLISTTAVQSSERTSPHVDTVKRFIAAFNEHDSNAMADLVGNDIEWLSIVGDQVTVETTGKGDLIIRVYYFSAEK